MENSLPAPQNHETPTSIMRQSSKMFFTIFMLTGALLSGIMMAFYKAETKAQLDNLQKQETFAVELQSQVAGDILGSIIGDLYFLSHQNELQDYITSKNPSALDQIATEYLAIAQDKPFYDQIRLLDTNGMETVRVNGNNGAPVRVANNKLQSKQKRYYFKDTYDLEHDDIFISPFDLNIERGIIEQPLKPMIRLGTPVLDSENQKRGIVLINYLGKNLLDKILASEDVSGGQTMLLNSAGYWLLSPDPDQEWGFMFNDEQRTFAVQHKEAWQAISSKKQGQIFNADGLFTFKTIYPVKQGYSSSSGSGKAAEASSSKITSNEYQWHLVSFTPANVIDSYPHHLRGRLFAFGAIMFLIIAGAAWGIAMATTRKKIYQTQLTLMAFFDPLTELPNRRLFFDRLDMTLEYGRRNQNMFGVLFLDLDGFKSINDTLGHEAGDELLCIVAKRLHEPLRKSDTVARLGGDEFAVIIGQLDSAQGAEIIAKKIIASLATAIQLEAGSVHIGASIGISLFPTDSTDAEELLKLADSAMYTSKDKGKNTYTFCAVPETKGDETT